MKQVETLPVFSRTAPYSIPAEYYEAGLHAYQKRYVMRRNYILMAFFGVLFLSFVFASVKDPTNRVSYVLMMVCLAMVFVLWYTPRKQRRMVIDAVREMAGEQYTAEHDGKELCIRTWQTEEEREEQEEIPETRLLSNALDVQEMEGFYLICDGKRMFYILPKEALDDWTPEISGEKTEE